MYQGLTVIVPTCNRPHHLSRCLGGLARQRLVPASVIVVDDSDKYDGVPRLFPGNLSVSVIHTRRLGPAGARNAAIAQVRSKYVGFLDDDSIPELDWSLACVELFDHHPHVTAQLGRILWSRRNEPQAFRDGFLPTLRQKIYDSRHDQFTNAEYCDMLTNALGISVTTALPGMCAHLSGGNCAVRKEFFDNHGAFDPQFRTLSDREMAYRILSVGGVIAYNPRMQAGHDHDPSVSRALRRCVRTASYLKLLDDLYPDRPWSRNRQDRFVKIQERLTILERAFLTVHRTLDWWASCLGSKPRRDPLLSGAASCVLDEHGG